MANKINQCQILAIPDGAVLGNEPDGEEINSQCIKESLCRRSHNGFIREQGWINIGNREWI